MVRVVACLITLFLSYSYSLAQRYFDLSGTVKDTSGRIIYGSSIQIRNDNIGTATDDNGYFKLRLEEGYYEIVITAIGYKDYLLNLPINKNTFVSIKLTENALLLKEIEINNKRHDPSWDIIQRVAANRSIINAELNNYRCEGYIKAFDNYEVDTVQKKKRNFFQKREPVNIDSVEANLQKANKAMSNKNFAEVNLVKYWGRPNYLKEERSGVRLLGKKNTLYFLTVTDGEFDFNKNQVSLGKLSEVKYVSPFSPGANISYRYKFIESYYENGLKIYKIKVIPRKIGNALFEGTVDIFDSIWTIRKIDFSLNPTHLPLYTEFSIHQDYHLTQEGYLLLSKQVFRYKKKSEDGNQEGHTDVIYTKYLTNIELPKGFFSSEVSSVVDSAYEREPEWWNKQRKDSLSDTEKIYTRYKDSLNIVVTSKRYLDSIDRIYNQLTFLKIIWWGQGYVNRDKKVKVEFAPLLTVFQPGMVGGFRLGYFVRYNRRFKNKQFLTVAPYLHYGFLNEDLKGSLYFSHLYNPVKRSRYYMVAAREFQMINPNDAFINMFRRSNFFEQWRFQVGHTFEILNGLYFTNYISFSDRWDIGNYKFLEAGDKVFKLRNDPITFQAHKSTEINFTLSFTPYQKYIREPKEKIILGSKFPTFSITYNQGVKGVLGSDVDFYYLQASIDQTLNMGRFGIGKYSIYTGKFFDTTYLPIVDYKYQRRGDPFLLTNPLGNYQLLPYTFPTFNWYLQVHYWHSFNGFITSAVPFFKKFNINAAAGSSLLWAPERDIKHFEVYYGLNKVFKLIRETFKVGVFYANGYNNIGGYYQGIKIAFEKYNIRDNSWAF